MLPPMALVLRDPLRAVSIACLCVASCARPPAANGPPEKAGEIASGADGAASAEGEDTPGSGAGSAWAPETYSPQPGSVPEPELEKMVETCGKNDRVLHEVASFVAQRALLDGNTPSLDQVNFELRRRGSPYVMPRLWSALASGWDEDALTEHVRAWSRDRKKRGELRCGAGSFERDGQLSVAVIQVDASADLAPLPTRVDPGSWVELEARFHSPTTSASVVLLPPEGAPRTVQTELRGDTARARFSLEARGTWTVQLMATQEGGPAPVALASITAGQAQPAAYDSSPVPGEGAFDPQLSPADALFVLVNAARRETGLPTLKRNATLDRAARAHSEDMRATGRIAHDTGRGDPARRVEAAGLSPKATGENVALAANVVRLHRVLWSSPSHRENLLLRRWDQAGIGVVEREDGSLLATQLFIDD